ncbi:MAG: glycine--tRNA ligase subunit beta, partial [Pseudomonadota bacterium]
MSTEQLLVEVGTEELPPTALKTLAIAFRDEIESGLRESELNFAAVHWYATPRRLAVIVDALQVQAPSRTVEQFGPPADRARDEQGNWTKAAEGFARRHGVDPDQLEVADTPKGQRLVHRAEVAGSRAVDAVPTVVEQALAKLPIPKRMRWGASRAEFVRPVHWVVLLLGDAVVPGSFMGIATDRITRGHRFHGSDTVTLNSAQDYLPTLAQQRVVADYQQRRDTIAAQVTAEADKLGGTAVIDDDLLDEVTGLVEWPIALTGGFDKAFLEVPAEALVSSMKEHQKYFHVMDEQGALMPNFITVSNIESADPAQVIAGNERVIRPRLADAAFFFNTDRKTPLAERLEQLKSVVFQQQLGTVYDKTERVAQLASWIATETGSSADKAQRAALLSKADLVTDMVQEFAKMQGIAGSYYAANDGEDDEVAGAITEQYLPKYAGDALPHSSTGVALALADRLDTLVGIFGIGQPPTGSKDPFALRRASLAVLRIMVEKQLDLDLRECLTKAVAGYPAGVLGEDTVEQVLGYMLDRFRAWYEDQSIPVEVFRAVSARGVSRPLDIDQRVQAVNAFAQLPQAQALAAANKRVTNILGKLEAGHSFGAVEPALLAEEA